MKKQDWIDEAEKLSIETDGLTVAQLKKAIEDHEPEPVAKPEVIHKPEGRGNQNIRDCDRKPSLKANRKAV